MKIQKLLGNVTSSTLQNQRVGFTFLDCQPFHYGHAAIINRMIQNHNLVIVGLNSSNGRSSLAPWSDMQQVKMLRNVYRSRLRPVFLKDVEPNSKSFDIDQLLTSICDLGFSQPTDYYASSKEEATPFMTRFWHKMVTDPSINDDESQRYFIDVNGCKVLRLLTVVDNHGKTMPKTEEIRKSVISGNSAWHAWVPPVNYAEVGLVHQNKN